MILNILWIVVILLAALSQWYIIEVKKRKPDHSKWFIIRVIVSLLFVNLYLGNGYMWYWFIPYMVFTFAWLFPFLLNRFRGKRLGYMSARGSKYDRFILKIFKHEELVFLFGMVFMVIAIALQFAYGTTPFNQI